MRKHETAVCGTARTVVWEVGKCENRRQMPFMISIYLLPDLYLIDMFSEKIVNVCEKVSISGRTTAVVRSHISCCALAHQLMCMR